MDAYDNSSFPALNRLLSQKDVVDKFVAMTTGKKNEIEIKKLTAFGEKLHRHLESAFPSIARKTELK